MTSEAFEFLKLMGRIGTVAREMSTCRAALEEIEQLRLDLADSRRRVEELRLWAESEADRTYGLYKTGSGPERGSAYFEGMSDAFSLMNDKLGASQGETPAKGSEGDKK